MRPCNHLCDNSGGADKNDTENCDDECYDNGDILLCDHEVVPALPVCAVSSVLMACLDLMDGLEKKVCLDSSVMTVCLDRMNDLEQKVCLDLVMTVCLDLTDGSSLRPMGDFRLLRMTHHPTDDRHRRTFLRHHRNHDHLA